MWDTVSVSPQVHNSDDDRHSFFRQDAQRPWPGSEPVHHCVVIIIILIIITSTAPNFISELGCRICVHTGDVRDTSYIFQRISVMLQRFNSVLLHLDTLPVDLPDL